jgi:hypothetical protein
MDNLMDSVTDRVKKEGIEIEYLLLPVTNLSLKYMTRMSKPIALALDTDIIATTVFSLEHDDSRQMELLRQECSKKYVKMMKDGGMDVDDSIKVHLVELKLVRA